MPRSASLPAPGCASSPAAAPHLVALAGEWALWRDIAVRTAGFPVSGLGVFASPDEQAGLRAVACDLLFRTAVTWQNRAAMHNAVAKIAAGAAAPPSRQRQREEVVASYWQRYCAKNDTIGFFGPLAWGRVTDDGPAVQASCGQLVSESIVHFEAWAIQALAEALDPGLTVFAGPQSEGDLRTQLERSRPELRDRGLAALGRLERCRSAAARAADPGALDTALSDLDRVFEELTGRSATRRPGETYGARTLLLLDCMRDLDLTVGPGIRDELAATLPPLLAGARWYCGRVYEGAKQVIGEAAAAIGPGSLARVLETVLPALRHLTDVVAAANGDLQRRWSVLLADPDPATIGARAAAAFADYAPAWPISVYQSADVQIAAPRLAAVNAGDYLCVVGDFHPRRQPAGPGGVRHPPPGQGPIPRRHRLRRRDAAVPDPAPRRRLPDDAEHAGRHPPRRRARRRRPAGPHARRLPDAARGRPDHRRRDRRHPGRLMARPAGAPARAADTGRRGTRLRSVPCSGRRARDADHHRADGLAAGDLAHPAHHWASLFGGRRQLGTQPWPAATGFRAVPRRAQAHLI